MRCRNYPSDLSDKEWALLKLPEKRRGPKRKWPFRRVLDAIFYTLKNGLPVGAILPGWTFLHGKRPTTIFERGSGKAYGFNFTKRLRRAHTG